MGKIRRLDDVTVSQIAAGEVIERPASVVKELVENAMDAKATRIFISVEESPRYKIMVNDNGEGMTREDLLLCSDRHTTSKIKKLDDLYEVSSYGFRGEALASIASVSKVTIKTQVREATEGWVLNSDKSIKSAVLPHGTTIEVSDLFYNTPAREKFLKSPQTEKSYVFQTVEELALITPHVSLELKYNGNLVFSYAASSLIDRVKTMFHRRWYKEEDHFFIIEDELKGFRLWALAGEPSLVTPSSKYLFFFVNSRCVRDKIISHAIKSAYGPASERGRWPYLVLFLEVPGTEIDVNVHPTKREVRFADSSFIHQWLFNALQRGIKQHQKNLIMPHIVIPAEAGTQFSHPEAPAEGSILNDKRVTLDPLLNLSANRQGGDDRLRLSPEPLKVPGTFFQKQERNFSSLNVLGQIKQSYIVCETTQKMILIDQHAAHERIVFEKLLKAFEAKGLEKQQLLVSEQVELTEMEKTTFDKCSSFFDKVGFDVSLYSERTLVVSAVPAVAAHVNPRALLHDLLSELETALGEKLLPEYLHKLFATIACHSVVTANHALSQTEMRALLNDLDHIEFTQCPHGRPIAIDFPFVDLEKRFKRI